MFFNKPKAPRPEQKAKLNKVLGEIKRRYNAFGQQMNNLPDTPNPLEASDDEMRKSLLDQREALSNMKTSLIIIQTTIHDALGLWPEGKHPLSLLIDATKLGVKLGDNLLEENLLYDRPNPLDSYSQNRRRSIFAENRQLGPEADKKFTESSHIIYELTGFILID